MASTLVGLAMLAAVVVSDWLDRALPPLLPRPLIQVGLGAIIGLTTTYRVSLSPDVFFLLFLPPLLFHDAWNIPRDALVREGWRVLELALGLVFVTVLGVGFAIHWMLPSMPTAVAFALAAVLSPTDAVAVSAIAGRSRFPTRLLMIIKGEALLNDASGLVCLRFAIVAIATGGFSIVDAATAFIQLAIGGAAIGAVMTLVIGRLKQVIAARLGEDPITETLISLLIPFSAYLVAETCNVSGVLAAVTAGLAMGYIELQGHALALTRVRREVVWDTVQTALNGMIFVLLGEQLPDVVQHANLTTAEAGHTSRWWLVGYVVVIGVTLHLVRMIWVWKTLLLAHWRRRRLDPRIRHPDWRAAVVATVSAVRGTTTLAGILTLPLALPDGSPLPARDLAICMAAGVIIFSLLVADVMLPMMLGRMDIPSRGAAIGQEMAARAAAADAALHAIEHAQTELAGNDPNGDDLAAVIARVAAPYQQRLRTLSQEQLHATAMEHCGKLESSIRLAALAAERQTIQHLGAVHAIDRATERKLVREIDLAEAVQESSKE